MTYYAKILIVVHLALSLILAAWAVGIYGSRIDFSDKGELKEKQRELKDALTIRDLAMARYDTAKANLQQAEALRPQLQAWYAAQLTQLEKGVDAAGKPVSNPVQELWYEKGALQLDPATQRPRLRDIAWTRPLQPLVDLDRLGQEYDKAIQDILAEKKQLDAHVAEEQRLTEEVNGDGQKKKGLRKQLEDVQEEMLSSLGEKEFLRRLERSGVYLVLPSIKDMEGEHEHLMRTLYNRKIEAQSQIHRQKQLESRLEELRTTTPGQKVARQP